MNSNSIEVITFLDRYCLAVLSEEHLERSIVIFKFPREKSNELLWVGI